MVVLVVVAAIIVLEGQAIHRIHHQAKVIMVAQEITMLLLMVRLVGVEHLKLVQMEHQPLVAMEEMEPHQLFLVLLQHTQVAAVVGQTQRQQVLVVREGVALGQLLELQPLELLIRVAVAVVLVTMELLVLAAQAS
jgi:hypothetical protein